MGERYIMGVDIGSSNVKAIIFSLRGEVISACSQEISDIIPGQNMLEQSPQLIWEQFCKAVKGCVENCNINSTKIVGLGIDSNRCGMILLDEDHVPLTNVVTWRDRRAVPHALKYHVEHPDLEHYEITGETGNASHVVMKILWAQRNAPELWNKTRYIYFSPMDYIMYKMLGKDLCSHSIAQSSGLMDIVSCEYSPQILKAVNVSADMLPTLYESTDIVGYIDQKMHEQLALAIGTPVLVGLCDASASQIGSGAIDDGTFCISIGTCAAIRTFVKEPIFFDNQFAAIRVVTPFGYIPSCSVTDAGGVLKWYRKNFCKYEMMLQQQGQGNCYRQLDEASAKIPIGCQGLTAITSLSGQIFNTKYTNASGALVGLRTHHTHAHVARSLMEGVGLQLKTVLNLFCENGYNISGARLVGGGAKSPFWSQMMADIFNIPIYIPECEEAGCLGSAIVAAIATGYFKDLSSAVSSMVRIKDSYMPNSKNVEAYQKLYTKVKLLQDALDCYYQRGIHEPSLV